MVQGLKIFTAMAAIAIMATLASPALGIADQMHGPGLAPDDAPAAPLQQPVAPDPANPIETGADRLGIRTGTRSANDASSPTTLDELSQPGGPLSDSDDEDVGPLGSPASNLPPSTEGIQMRPLSADDIAEADIPENTAEIRALGQQVLGPGAEEMSTEDISEALDALAHANAAHANALAAADDGTLEAPEPLNLGTSRKLTPQGLDESSPAYGRGDLANAEDNIGRLRARQPPRGMANESNTASTSTDAADSGLGSSDDESSLSDAIDSAETAQQVSTTELSNAIQGSNAAADAINAGSEATDSATQAVESATNELAGGPSSIDIPSSDLPGEGTAAEVIEDTGIDPADFG